MSRRAMWHGAVLAESDKTVVVENNHYFPPISLNRKFLRDSDHQTQCPWKGTASYYDVIVEDQVNANAAWYYHEPKPEAENIRDYVAFWHGVQVSD